MIIQRRGFNWLEDAVKPGNYNNLWCAGQTVEMIHSIKPIQKIVEEVEGEFFHAYENLKNNISN
jgi:nitronate monooxygenase